MSDVRIHATGATVIGWHAPGQREVLWVSPLEDFASGAIRGGIPICFPWFGNARTPAHGLVRAAAWTEQSPQRWTISSSDVGDTASWTAQLEATADAAAGPGAAAAGGADAAAGAGALTVTMTVTNTGDEPFRFEQALHTYLRVSDVRNVEVTGLDGAGFFDKVTGGTSTQAGPLRLSGPTDRIYSSAGEILVHDPSWNRSIRVVREGSANAVIWNPWEEAAGAMADVGEHWREFICVEGANIGDAGVELAPGASHEMIYRLELRQ